MTRSNVKALLTATLLASGLAAQDTGSLYGTVTDPAGGLVPGAQIAATSQERGNLRTAVSNERGEWVLTQVPIGTYTVKVEAQGFKLFERRDVAVDAEQNVHIDAALTLGSASETVTVTAEATER